MRLLLTTNARLYKKGRGEYFTPLVYEYEFFRRYLSVFNEISLVAHTTEYVEEKTDMLRVDGENLFVFEVPFPRGKIQYVKKYLSIRRAVERSIEGCDAAILRIPDQLAFQIYPLLIRKGIPVAVEVTSDPLDFFAPGSYNSPLRPFLRALWYINQKKACANAEGTSYVTKAALQKRYPPIRALKGDGFTSFYTSADLDQTLFATPRKYSASQEKPCSIIHVATDIGNAAKGYYELITALGRLYQRGVRTKLVCVGGGKLNDKVERKIDEYGYREHIRLTGLISNKARLSEELRGADLLVFPSYREGLPRVVLEAMAAGLPCIATELPGVQELLDRDCLVPIRNIELLEAKIYECLSNPDFMTRQSRRNYQKAMEYESSKVQEKRRQFYEKLKEIAIQRA